MWKLFYLLSLLSAYYLSTFSGILEWKKIKCVFHKWCVTGIPNSYFRCVLGLYPFLLLILESIYIDSWSSNHISSCLLVLHAVVTDWRIILLCTEITLVRWLTYDMWRKWPLSCSESKADPGTWAWKLTECQAPTLCKSDVGKCVPQVMTGRALEGQRVWSKGTEHGLQEWETWSSVRLLFYAFLKVVLSQMGKWQFLR